MTSGYTTVAGLTRKSRPPTCTRPLRPLQNVAERNDGGLQRAWLGGSLESDGLLNATYLSAQDPA